MTRVITGFGSASREPGFDTNSGGGPGTPREACSGLPLAPLLVEQPLEPAVPAHVLEVGVLEEVAVVAVPQVERAMEGIKRRVEVLQVRVAAGQVVERDGILGPEAGEAEIRLERLVVAAGPRE